MGCCRWLVWTGGVLFVASACSAEARDPESALDETGTGDWGDTDSGTADTDTGSTDEDEGGDDGTCPPGGCLDTIPDESGGSGGCMEGDDCPVCGAPVHQPCDGSPTDVVAALGLNCPGEPVVDAALDGSPDAAGTLALFGTGSTFPPREGARYAVLGSGFISDLNVAGDLGACTKDLGNYDPGTTLPPPIQPVDVGGLGCADDPGLVGTGDCSNTIQEQFMAASGGAFDYTELRVVATVPDGVSSIAYDFAFFSYEYPQFWQSIFNDIYIGWLESESWTGNISFDEMGNPISVNAGFFDFLDADTPNTHMQTGMPHPICPMGAGCSASELAGTCMAGHGGTRWLTSVAPVQAGEEITLVFAVMDLGDSVLDSYVFLDNFQWGCDGEQPPTTHPVD